ncbi:MAG: SpoIIE family protein phosphatase [Acidobacteriota bacterium]|nr:SpoIIE family protein phosphatase [Acidobacteriota bacterium]
MHDPSRLEALLESAQLLHSSLDLDDLLRHLLRSVMGRLLVKRGLIAVTDNGVMHLALVRGMPGLKTGDVFDEEAARVAGVELILPIGDTAQPTGLLGIGRPLNGEVSPDEQEFLSALLGIAASGIDNARAHADAHQLNLNLDQKIQELRTLLDLVRGLSAALDPEAVAGLLALTLAGRWAVRRYAVAAWKEGHPLVLRQKGMTLSDLQNYQSLLAELPEAVAVTDLPAGDFKELLAAQQGAILFPLRAADSTCGLVVLGARPGGLPYTEDDFEFGAGLCAQAVVAFENAWYVRETLERKTIEQELALAASIQEGLFPDRMPTITGYEVAARSRPARQCGGDYYDALAIEIMNGEASSGGRPYLLCVADVSGKGLPASLLMSNMQATLRALLGRFPSLGELAARTNELLHATSPSNKFVTAILVEIDPATGAGRYVNAGHNDCFLLRHDGERVEMLKSTGLPLGMQLGLPYEEKSFQFEPGDLLALYSDGVSEAYDEEENEWGEERLLACLRSVNQDTAPHVVAKVFQEIDLFAGAAPQHDDITLLILKRAT